MELFNVVNNKKYKNKPFCFKNKNRYYYPYYYIIHKVVYYNGDYNYVIIKDIVHNTKYKIKFIPCFQDYLISFVNINNSISKYEIIESNKVFNIINKYEYYYYLDFDKVTNIVVDIKNIKKDFYLYNSYLYILAYNKRILGEVI